MRTPDLMDFGLVSAFLLGTLGCSVNVDEPSSADAGEAARVEAPLVVGEDERVLVEDPESEEFRTVARIEIDWKSRRSSCSGTVIGDGYVLTAAHCVYNPETGGYAQGVTVVPGASGGAEPFGRFAAKHFEAHPKWIEGLARGYSDRGYDLALVEIRRAPKLGRVELHAATHDELEHGELSIAGYPGDLGGRDMYVASGRLVSGSTVLPDLLIHSIDSFGGNSGSGIRAEDGRLVGTHVAHDDGPFAHNKGMRLTQSKIDWLEERMERG